MSCMPTIRCSLYDCITFPRTAMRMNYYSVPSINKDGFGKPINKSDTKLVALNKTLINGGIIVYMVAGLVCNAHPFLS